MWVWSVRFEEIKASRPHIKRDCKSSFVGMKLQSSSFVLLATAALLGPSQVQSWGGSSGAHSAATSGGGSSNSRTPAPPPAPDTCCEGGATGYNASLLSVPATCPPPPSDASNQSYNALWPPLNASYRGNNAWRTAGYITCPASAPKCTRLRCTALGGGHAPHRADTAVRRVRQRRDSRPGSVRGVQGPVLR